MVEAKTHLQRPSLQAIGRWLNRCGDGRDRGLQRPGTGADGAVWEVAAGAGGEQVQLPRFLPSPLQIKADDTERWANQSPKGESHTVTPLLSGGHGRHDHRRRGVRSGSWSEASTFSALPV